MYIYTILQSNIHVKLVVDVNIMETFWLTCTKCLVFFKIIPMVFSYVLISLRVLYTLDFFILQNTLIFPDLVNTTLITK